MASFDPQPNEEFSLNIDQSERKFRAMPHPRASDFTHAMEGGKAIVYRVQALGAGHYDYALKVMKFKHQDPSLDIICSNLDRLKTLPGLAVCERQCLSPSRAADTIQQYRNLKFAILMPWIQGLSWFDVLCLGQKGQRTLDKDGSFRLASNFAAVLSHIETLGIAHCDLSAANVLLNPDPQKLQVELIDVEDIFVPGFQQPNYQPLGTPGYQHRTSSQGQWHERADRFAGAILLGEMLGWHDQAVQSISYGETYFEPNELQSTNCRRLDVLTRALSSHGSNLADLLRQAWESNTLDECPSIKEWREALNHIKLKKHVEFGEAIGPSIGAVSPPIWDKLGTNPPPPPIWDPLARGPGSPVEWESANTLRNPVAWEQEGAQKPNQQQPPPPVQWDNSAPSFSEETEDDNTN